MENKERVILKTLLADDDYLVRSYLKTLPAWEKEGFWIEAVVRDGEEALKTLQEISVDLVVTDISMPLINGIELIRKIREKDKEVYIIVLSCHDDFEYVREAMKLGADEYVLKNTLEDNTLNPLLFQARQKIEERRQIAAKPEVKSNSFNLVNDNSGFLFFNRVLSGVSSEKETEEMRKNAGIDYPFHNCAVVSMSIEHERENEEQWFELEMEKYFHDFYQRLCEALRRVQGEEHLHCEVVYLGAGVFCCFLDLSEERKSSVMRQQLISTATACYRICKGEFYAFRIGASNVCMGSQAIRQAYQQSREVLKMGFYEVKQILYYDSNQKMAEHTPKKAQQFLKEADSIFYKKGKEEFLSRCFEACRAFEEEQTQSRKVIQWLRTLQGIVGVEEETMGSIRNMKQVHTSLKAMAERAKSCETAFIPEEVKETVRVAAEFVLEHYQEPIGLNEAAEAAGVNASYLSYIFSQEMGTRFSSFLLQQRMRCARNMLTSTNVKIREVAEKSGFNDYHYFAKTFKKMNGVSPAEYRKNN